MNKQEGKGSAEDGTGEATSPSHLDKWPIQVDSIKRSSKLDHDLLRVVSIANLVDSSSST